MKEWLESLDRVVSWGGNYFDVPFLNYRLLVHRVPRLNIQEHFDLKAWTKRHDPLGLFSLNSPYHRGLEAHANALNIPAKTTPLNEQVWEVAADGDVDAIIEVATHNVEDVITLRSVYDKLYEPVDERKRQLSLF